MERTEDSVFDLNELKSYREGNRLEVKKALGRDGQGELHATCGRRFRPSPAPPVASSSLE